MYSSEITHGKFQCPVCYGTHCEPVLIPRPPKPPERMPFFQCAGCSLIFAHAWKFTATAGHITGSYVVPCLNEDPRTYYVRQRLRRIEQWRTMVAALQAADDERRRPKPPVRR